MSRVSTRATCRFLMEMSTLACVLVLSIATAGSASAQLSPEAALDIEVELSGTKLVAGEETPVKVRADEPTKFKLLIRNKGEAPHELTGLRFEGKVIGIPVFRCDVLSPVMVPGGQTVEREFEIEPACLRDQATGLVPASVTVHGQGQTPLRRWAVVLDIKGSLKSIYGLTGVFLVAVTVFSLGALLAALLRQRLPRNRFSRALRFTTVGIGVGFSLVFVLAATAVMVPDAENWIPVVVIPAIVFTIGGYLSPTPQREPALQAEMAGATQVMQQAFPGSAPTSQLPQTSATYPEASGDQGSASAGQAAPTVSAPVTPTIPGARTSIPTKKVRPVSSTGEATQQTERDSE